MMFGASGRPSMLASMACLVRRARALMPASFFGNPCRRSSDTTSSIPKPKFLRSRSIVTA